jgi:hypothetical protein
LLTPIALAYWIAGDGSYDKVRKSVILCTDSFSVEEIELLREILFNKFELASSRVKSGSREEACRIRFYSSETLKLQKIVGEILPSMMKYRIGL